MFRRVFILVFAALLLGSAPAVAQGRFVHPYGPREAVPLDRILPQIRNAHPGTFSDVDGPFADPDGRLHYRIKWLTPQGRVVWFDADARTGRLLGVNHGWGGFGPYPRSYMGRPPGMPEPAPAGRFIGRVPWGPPPAFWGGRGFRGGWRGPGRRGR